MDRYLHCPEKKEPELSLSLMKYSYKTIIVAPAGLRVSGDDQTTTLAKLLDKKSNALGKEGWEMVSALPTLSSGGSVSKVIAVFKRLSSANQ